MKPVNNINVKKKIEKFKDGCRKYAVHRATLTNFIILYYFIMNIHSICTQLLIIFSKRMNESKNVFLKTNIKLYAYILQYCDRCSISHYLYSCFIKLTHLPTSHLQPMIQDSSQECDRTLAPFSIVQRFIQAPSSITASGPIVTLGPILQFLPILALGSCNETQDIMMCKNFYNHDFL